MSRVYVDRIKWIWENSWPMQNRQQNWFIHWVGEKDLAPMDSFMDSCLELGNGCSLDPCSLCKVETITITFPYGWCLGNLVNHHLRIRWLTSTSGGAFISSGVFWGANKFEGQTLSHISRMLGVRFIKVLPIARIFAMLQPLWVRC